MINDLCEILKYGIKKSWLWTLVWTGVFIYSVITYKPFSDPNWIFILVIVLSTVTEIISIIKTYNMSATLNWFSLKKENQKEGRMAYISFMLGTGLKILFILLCVLALYFTNTQNLMIGPVLIALWWALHFSSIIRSYFEQYSKKAKLGLINELKQGLADFANTNKEREDKDENRKD